jgi:hypothetical protein
LRPTPRCSPDALFEVEDLLGAELAAGDEGPAAAAETDPSVVA